MELNNYDGLIISKKRFSWQAINNLSNNKQFKLFNNLQDYYYTKKTFLLKEISKKSHILPQSFRRSIKNLENKKIISNFNYNNRKIENCSFNTFDKNRKIYIEVPQIWINLGVLTKNSLFIYGYLSLLPNQKWSGSIYELHSKINHWLFKNKINVKLSLSTVYRNIKLLNSLKIINKLQNRFIWKFNNKWVWHLYIEINPKINSLGIRHFIDYAKRHRKKILLDSNELFDYEIWETLD